MIVSILLFAVLFIATSMGWAFVSHDERSSLSHKTFLLALSLTTAAGVLASVFFLRAFDETSTLLTPALVFALTFVVTLVAGIAVAASPKMASLFSKIREVWKGEAGEMDRSDVVDEILDRITDTGKVDAFERQLIENILKFSDKIVREVMVPRGDVVAINIDEEPRRVIRKVVEEGFSRMPVFSGAIDNIVGIIYAKDLITMAEGSGAIVLQDLLRDPYYVPESKKISQLLREMQLNKVHLAVVVDEFGGTEGIVTLEDVLEEIVGEIQDEYDESLSEFTRDENGAIHFPGSMTVDRFAELLQCEIPREDDYDTMAGFVQKLAGKLPQKGEVYRYGEMSFVIEDLARHRIKRLKVSFREHPSVHPLPEPLNEPTGLDTPPVEAEVAEVREVEAAVEQPRKTARRSAVRKKGVSRKAPKSTGVRAKKGSKKS